jgi:hypothetical protein
MITSMIHVLILVPVFFVLLKVRALRRGTLNAVELDWRSCRPECQIGNLICSLLNFKRQHCTIC